MSNNVYPGLRDRVVIITGAGQGIGRAYAHHFAGQGAISVIAEFNADAGKRVEAEVKADGGRALFVQTDVADEASTKAMAQAALDAFGRIDCLINNAAVFSRITMGPFWELPVDEWRRAMDVNITGAFLCARAVVPTLQERRFGRIINVSSATVLMGRENYLHYITSKSAMIGMTRSMARELGDWNITVNTFWPGVTKTEIERPSVPNEVFERMTQMQSIKRLTGTDDLAHGVMFLCSDDAGFITGQSLQVDGGLTFI
ncbi:SDR family NAD(P)-dependent oxidoreductase [Immundisolibacter sp.]|uniref:SDR family NAD(P)-dependent oxidoreductase n=3 Tax=Immundisolibacter sp. TaxID=1934948 RepID=UPI003563E077